MDYQVSIKAKLDYKASAQLIDYEEKYFTSVIAALKPEELQDLHEPIWLVAASEGSINNKVQVPKKIRLMVKLVDDLLKADESQVEVKLFISLAKL